MMTIAGIQCLALCPQDWRHTMRMYSEYTRVTMASQATSVSRIRPRTTSSTTSMTASAM